GDREDAAHHPNHEFHFRRAHPLDHVGGHQEDTAPDDRAHYDGCGGPASQIALQFGWRHKRFLNRKKSAEARRPILPALHSSAVVRRDGKCGGLPTGWRTSTSSGGRGLWNSEASQPTENVTVVPISTHQVKAI